MAFLFMMSHTCALLSCGLAAQINAATPATIGEAKLVPHFCCTTSTPGFDWSSPTIVHHGPQMSTTSPPPPPEKFESGAGTLPAFADVASSSQPPTQMTPSFSHGQYQS